MDEVVEGKRYKIYVSNSKLESEILQSSHDGLIFEPVTTIDEADIVVLVEDERAPVLSQNSQDQLAQHPRKKEVIAIFLAKEANIDNFDEQEFLHFEGWRKQVGLEITTLVNSSEKDRKKEFEEALVFLMAGSPQKSAASFSREEPSKVVGSPVVPAPAAASAVVPVAVPAPGVVAPKAAFFNYPKKLQCRHTRQLRSEYVEKNLFFNGNESDAEIKKKLVLIFVHYMSIRHVNSWFSRKMEEFLIDKLGLTEVPKLQNRHIWWRRAFIRGKKYDHVARAVKDKMLAQYNDLQKSSLVHAPKDSTNMDLMIDLLQPVDSIEKSRFGSKDKIKNTIDLVNRVYDDLQKPWDLRAYNVTWFGRLTEHQTKVLPSTTSRVLARRVGLEPGYCD